MKRSFIDDLEQFAYSVDIVPEGAYQRLGTLLKRYFAEFLRTDFYEVLVTGHRTREHNPVLTTLWSNRKPYTMYILHGDAYTGQAAYAFDKEKALWITNKARSSLTSSSDYIDSWSGVTDLPSYWDPEHIMAATSIIIPLASPAVGFMTLEFTRHLESTDIARSELSRLANALRIIMALYEGYKLQTANTDNAINALNDRLTREQSSPFVRPQVFLAFSARADNGVVGYIKEVIKKWAHKLDVVSWDQMSQSGNINHQVLEAVSNATYGICYFSEPEGSGSAQPEYRDNPNAVFEAGMLQSLANSPDAKPTAWIPIREKNSPPAPFDFASERTIVIERDQYNEVNKQQLCYKLDNQIKEWFAR